MRRLFVTDRHSGKKFLVDTGADVSIFSIAFKDKRNKSKFTLCAANDIPSDIRSFFSWISSYIAIFNDFST